MRHVYRNLKPIPIPPDGYCNRYNGTVFRMYKDGRGHRSRTVIGRMAETGMMFPNDNFRELYPDLWTEHYGENLPEQRFVRTGLYAFCLAAGYRTLLYPVLADSLGGRDANALMDFAMFSIQDDDDESPIHKAMGRYMLFLAMRMTEAWYRKFFSEELSPVLIRMFRANWLKQLKKEQGLESVWLCTGTADLGSATNAGSISGCISYVWAAETRVGRPVSCFVCKGAQPSRKDLEEISSFISSCNVAVKGVILDSDYATPDVLKEIKDSGLEYIVRLKPETYGYADLYARYAKDIRWNIRKMIEETVFGIACQGRLFSPAEPESCTGLFYSGDTHLMNKQLGLVADIHTAQKQLQQRLAANPDKVSVPDEFREYLSLERDDKGVLQIVCDREKCQKIVDNCGYFALASSADLSAREMYAGYKLCLASEKQFTVFRDMLLKDTIGLFSAGMYSDKAVENFFVAGLVAAVIRTEMKLVCDTLADEDLTQEMQESRSDDDDDFWLFREKRYDWEERILSSLHCFSMFRAGSADYDYIENTEPHAERFLACFGITTKHMEALTRQKILQDIEKSYEGKRTIPTLGPAKPGRAKGSKNKKTLEKERQLREAIARGEAEPAVQRGRGRPKGSKNKKTLEKERQLGEAAVMGEATSAEAPPAVKRGRGRPKGSKNKKTLEKERQLEEAVVMGEVAPAEAEPAEAAPAAKRGRGRLKGSKNRKTLERERHKAAGISPLLPGVSED